MTKASADELLVRKAVAAATVRGDRTIFIYYKTAQNVPALSGLISQEQLAAFDAMDARYVHPRRVKLKLADVVDALA